MTQTAEVGAGHSWIAQLYVQHNQSRERSLSLMRRLIIVHRLDADEAGPVAYEA